jgi:hypothetical protein
MLTYLLVLDEQLRGGIDHDERGWPSFESSLVLLCKRWASQSVLTHA